MLQRMRPLTVIMLALAVVVTGGCTGVSSDDNEEPTPTPLPPPVVEEVPTYVVQRGEVIDEVSFNGRVSARLEEELFFESGGRIESVLVARNDVVEAGQMLAELENDDLERQLSQAQITLGTAESNLATAEEGSATEITAAEGAIGVQRLQLQKLRGSVASLDLDVQLARARLDAAKAGPTGEELAVAQTNLDRAKNALWAAQLSRDAACGNAGIACDQAQAGVLRAESDVTLQQLALESVQAGPSATDVLALQAAYERALQARRNVDTDIAILSQQIATGEASLARLREQTADPQATAAVQQAQLAVERIESQIAATRIFSTIAGRVTTMSIVEGSEVVAFRTAMIVANEEELEVTAEPTEEQQDKLAVGMPVEMVLANLSGQVLTGEITQLPFGGTSSSTALQDVDRRTHISIEATDVDLSPGDLLRVDVVAAQKADVLWLPPSAIRTFSGRSFVVVQEEGAQRRVDVSVGIQGIERVEILDGLEEGQVVVAQ